MRVVRGNWLIPPIAGVALRFGLAENLARMESVVAAI